MSNNEDVKVHAPDRWMEGWDRRYKRLLTASDEELTDIQVSRSVQHFLHSIDFLGLDPNDLNVLELACGDGEVACCLGKHGFNVDCFDALQSAADLTHHRAKVMGVKSKIHAFVENIDTFDIPEGEYDVIVALQCLQFLFERTIPRLREIIDALKPGGFFVYSGNSVPPSIQDNPFWFISLEDMKEEFKGWEFYLIGSDVAIHKPDDKRENIWVVTRKPF